MGKGAGWFLALSEKARRAMMDLGLTSYEIKAYTSLLDFGPAAASEISRSSGVPYSKIYEVLNNLVSKGWVQEEQTRPSKFYPKPPAAALETMRFKLESSRRQSEEVVLRELSEAYEKKGGKEMPEIWIVRGTHNILSQLKEMLQGTGEELLVAMPSIVAGAVSLLSPVLAELKERGVKVSLMTSEDLDDEILAPLSRLASVRVREQMYGGGVISDARQVLLLLSGEEGEENSSLAIWADHAGLAKFAKNYFEYLRNDSRIYTGPKIQTTQTG